MNDYTQCIHNNIFLYYALFIEQFHLTNEFVIIHSFGIGGGNIPWVYRVFIISAICCCSIEWSRVF